MLVFTSLLRRCVWIRFLSNAVLSNGWAWPFLVRGSRWMSYVRLLYCHSAWLSSWETFSGKTSKGWWYFQCWQLLLMLVAFPMGLWIQFPMLSVPTCGTAVWLVMTDTYQLIFHEVFLMILNIFSHSRLYGKIAVFSFTFDDLSVISTVLYHRSKTVPTWGSQLDDPVRSFNEDIKASCTTISKAESWIKR